MGRKKIAMIGAGQIGGNLALLAAEQAPLRMLPIGEEHPLPLM